MKKTALPAILAIFFITISFTACDDFFSSGWGSPRDYRVENINLTVNNVERWFDRSIGNPPLAMRVNEAILLRLDDPNLSPEDRRVFLMYGVRIAVASSNMGVIILSNALGALADLADNYEDMADMLLEILGSIQSDFRNAGGSAAADNIANMVMRNNGIQTGPNGAPIFSGDSFANDASPSDVAKIIMVLALAEAEYRDLDMDEYWDFDLYELGLELDGNYVVIIDTSEPPSPTLLALAAYLNLVNTDDRFEDNFLTGAIRDSFFGSNTGSED